MLKLSPFMQWLPFTEQNVKDRFRHFQIQFNKFRKEHKKKSIYLLTGDVCVTMVSVKCQVQTVDVRVLSQTCELLEEKLKELIILHSVINELLSDL